MPIFFYGAYKLAMQSAICIPFLGWLPFIANARYTINIHEVDSLNQFKSLLKMYFVGVSLVESLFMGLYRGWPFVFCFFFVVRPYFIMHFIWLLLKAFQKHCKGCWVSD